MKQINHNLICYAMLSITSSILNHPILCEFVSKVQVDLGRQQHLGHHEPKYMLPLLFTTSIACLRIKEAQPWSHGITNKWNK